MSSVSKRKITQNDLRSMMAKKKRMTEKHKINSPFARYLEDNTLLCVICNSVVKTETIWNIHVNSKHHRENFQMKKNLEKDQNSFQTASREHLEHKPKGILKNKCEIPVSAVTTKIINDDQSITSDVNDRMDIDEEPTISSNTNELPEGFFDDPLKDAKARNVEYKNVMDEEWEQFQKEIQEENMSSAKIIDDNQEFNAADREIELIDEHMRLWSKIQVLEETVESVHKKVGEMKSGNESHNNIENKIEDADSSYGSDDDNDDCFLDWRSKRAFR